MAPRLAKTCSLFIVTDSNLSLIKLYVGTEYPPCARQALGLEFARLDVDFALAGELELEALARALADHRPPVHVEDELLVDVALVPDEGVRVDHERGVGVDLEG